jgi:hypothetical protein
MQYSELKSVIRMAEILAAAGYRPTKMHGPLGQPELDPLKAYPEHLFELEFSNRQGPNGTWCGFMQLLCASPLRTCRDVSCWKLRTLIDELRIRHTRVRGALHHPCA